MNLRDTAISEREICQRFNIHLDLDDSGERTVYFSEKSDLSILDYLRFRMKIELRPIRISEELLKAKMSSSQIENTIANEIKGKESANKNHAADQVSDNKIVNVINSIITESITAGASDIHLEPSENNLKVRTRIDGVLFNKAQLDLADHPEIISRIKIMSGLDIAEKRRPQDGRIRFSQNGRLVDIRVSVIPTDFGEKAVLRILDKDQLRLNLASLGFTAEQLEIFKRNVSSTSGIILVTGPTGSGKTTTLYAALNHLKSGDVNISTVEDPIEYSLEGINQTQVKPEINLTFSAMLRALLRQDPNIIMVGEIRDRDTLEIAIRASQTGHLVLSTVHTNSAVSTITRLLDLGTEPFLLSSSLKMIVAQRLVRKICPNCKSNKVSEEYKVAVAQFGESGLSTLTEGQGCSQCNNSGYRGRTALYEVLQLNDEMREIIHKRGSERELLKCACIESFKTMKENSIDLIKNGLTTPAEVIRELGT